MPVVRRNAWCVLEVQTEGGCHSKIWPLGYTCGARGANLKTVFRTTGRSLSRKTNSNVSFLLLAAIPSVKPKSVDKESREVPQKYALLVMRIVRCKSITYAIPKTTSKYCAGLVITNPQKFPKNMPSSESVCAGYVCWRILFSVSFR